MQNFLTEGCLPVTLLQLQTILFKNVDVCRYMEPALLMM